MARHRRQVWRRASSHTQEDLIGYRGQPIPAVCGHSLLTAAGTGTMRGSNTELSGSAGELMLSAMLGPRQARRRRMTD
jgi:hypothetical protein